MQGVQPTTRRIGPGVALAAALATACAWIAWSITTMGDYATEMRPAIGALVRGHLADFAAQSPVYGGSAWPRAPFVLTAHALGGGDLALYRAGALACMLAAAALAWALEARMRAAGRPWPDRLAVVLVIVAAPVILRTLRDGHPEDVLAAVLAVAAVLAALRDRPALAGIALGLAVAGKPWAIIAAGPVLVAVPGRRGVLCAFAIGSAAAAVLPILLLSGGTPAAAQPGALTTTGRLFHPQQIFWPLREAHANGGFTGPSWLQPLSHPLIVLLAAGLSALFAVRRRPRQDALLLLALLLLLRCLLDPWNNAYYAVPLVLTLATWEALTRPGLPVLALSAGALTWLSFVKLGQLLGWDGQAAAYLAWTVPLAAVLAVAVYAPGLMSSATARRTSPGAT